MPTRRTVLTGAAIGATAALAGGAWAVLGPSGPPVRMGGADMVRGHRLRDGRFPEPTREERTGVAIVGGGVAGLSAAWTLADAGHRDFRVLELEDSIGGNARGGRNAVSAYPLGAHYLTLPNREAGALVHLLERLGIITGRGTDGTPTYDPYALVADGQERILWQGRWHEGLVPTTGLTARDAADLAAFDAAMARMRAAMGADGRPAFATPMAYSSRDAAYTDLDQVSFAEWIARRGWQSPVLLTHLRYCCRDDYGCEPQDISAWAGIHYFAGRRAFASAEVADNVLTWPDGNAYLVRRMAEAFPGAVESGRIVWRVVRDGDGVVINSFDVASNASVRTHADAAILALPHFLAARMAPGLVSPAAGFSHSPWLVANITVGRMPSGRGAPLAWDNVGFMGESLGYVVATHQTLTSRPNETVLTWYLPLSEGDPAARRRELMERAPEYWRDRVVTDLLRLNPELEGAIQSVALWRWGHAMVRPTPGFMTSTALMALAATAAPLFLAHSDLSGLSLFEEAHYRGVAAAEGAMRHLGLAYESRL
jgi:glycine/D-amino acid oxidase-like deaminating enzyme